MFSRIPDSKRLLHPLPESQIPCKALGALGASHSLMLNRKLLLPSNLLVHGASVRCGESSLKGSGRMDFPLPLGDQNSLFQLFYFHCQVWTSRINNILSTTGRREMGFKEALSLPWAFSRERACPFIPILQHGGVGLVVTLEWYQPGILLPQNLPGGQAINNNHNNKNNGHLSRTSTCWSMGHQLCTQQLI